MVREKSLGCTLSRGVSSLVLLTGLCFTVFLFFLSLFRTVSCQLDAYLGEYSFSALDNGFLNILMLVIMTCMLYLLWHLLERPSLRWIRLGMLLWILAVGFLFVYSASRAPEGDAEVIANTAFLASGGNFTALSDYLDQHPFRIGLAFYEEIFFRLLRLLFPAISRGYCYMSLQVVNVLFWALGCHGLVEMSGKLYHSQRAQKLTAVFLMFFFPALLSCTSLSGSLASFSLSILSLWFLSAWMDRRGFFRVLLSGLFMGLALSLKLDAALVVLAVALLWLLRCLRDKRLRAFLALLLYLSAVLLVEAAPIYMCEARAGTDYGSGDMSVRLAMGLDEMETGSLRYAGMYTAASAELTDSLAPRRQQAQELGTFDAFTRQWNEPSFHSLYMNQNCQRYRETGFFYRLLCERGDWLLLRWMDLYQGFLLGGAAIALLLFGKSGETGKALPAFILVTGLVFHLVFPADSRYAMKYYLLMIPLAAYAFDALFHRHEARNGSMAAK